MFCCLTLWEIVIMTCLRAKCVLRLTWTFLPNLKINSRSSESIIKPSSQQTDSTSFKIILIKTPESSCQRWPSFSPLQLVSTFRPSIDLKLTLDYRFIWDFDILILGLCLSTKSVLKVTNYFLLDAGFIFSLQPLKLYHSIALKWFYIRDTARQS